MPMWHDIMYDILCMLCEGAERGLIVFKIVLVLIFFSIWYLSMDISQINNMGFREFIATFGNVINNNPLCAAAVWNVRPFSSVEDLHRCFMEFLYSLSSEGISDFVYRYMLGWLCVLETKCDFKFITF